jgi:spore coat polysaccharide biosynthesis protein SpsF
MSATADCLVVVQARLASTRLPAKALLPIAGMPSLVLCARRAANSGLRVVLATSVEPADDALAAAAQQAGIAVKRGPLDVVLGRFAQACADLPDDGVVVRLTADNMFPDGRFVSALVDEFRRRGLDYLGSASPADGRPYGLSAEVFSAALLRRAHAGATSAFDREHVTPWIRREGRAATSIHEGAPANWSRLRCTLDTFDDYTRLLQVFAGEADPIGAPWERLVERLAAATPQGQEPRCPFALGRDGRVHSVLSLGTVQLGLPYGIANQGGLPDDATASALLHEAIDAGITTLDSARAYGRSEERIGALLPAGHRGRIGIVTKLDPLTALPADAAPQAVRDAVDASVFRSLHALRERTLDTLLLHRWAHHDAWGGEAWARLLALRGEGVIQRLGASVATPAEAIAALADPHIQHLQCPVNLVDARWREPAFLAAVEKRPDVVVHARSTLLQGLLTLPPAQWPAVPGYDREALGSLLDDCVTTFGRTDRSDLCLAYVRGLPWVHSLVVGMETIEQLRTNLSLAQRPPLTADERAHLEQRLPVLPLGVVDPSAWSR